MRNRSFFNIRNAIISFLLFIFMYYIINSSPIGLARLVEITDGQSILDMEMLKGYSVDKAYNILKALGEEGRAFNLRYILPLDFPFPLTYGLFYFITITLIIKHFKMNIKRPWIFGLVGLFAALFDWLENIMIYNIIKKYPQELELTVKTASIFTQIKSLFNMLSIVLILLGLIVLAIKSIINWIYKKV